MRHDRITKLGAATLTALTLFAGATAAGATTTAAELARLEVLFTGATPGSPAQFRVLEEQQRIAAGSSEHEVAQFRAVEDGTR